MTITEVGTLIESVSNNAVCEGFIDDRPFLFSFGGIDSTKRYSGIHQRSFRYDIESGESIVIPPLPDSRGKVASAASRIGNIIYITGGYYVNSNGSEESSDRIHRYDILANEYLADGAPIPVATDDHVQAVWRDSLIYLVTGWKDSNNITDVQIYNPKEDAWLEGTSLPNSNNYKSFGASGTILNDSIFYFGGAASTFGFPIQNSLRKGVINPDDPTEVIWSVTSPDPAVVGYRMAATSVYKELHWVGGSEVTYNYDGVAYNGTGGVPTSNRDLYIGDGLSWSEERVELVPMDLRGIAKVNDTIQYLVGGMLADQLVSNKVYKLEWSGKTAFNQNLQSSVSQPILYPNPCRDLLVVSNKREGRRIKAHVYNLQGHLLESKTLAGGQLDMEAYLDGIYMIRISDGETSWTQKIVKASN